MNNYEKQIKDLEKENLDLKIKLRIVETQKDETDKKVSYMHYKVLIIGYVFSSVIAPHLGDLGIIVVCSIALLILTFREVNK